MLVWFPCPFDIYLNIYLCISLYNINWLMKKHTNIYAPCLLVLEKTIWNLFFLQSNYPGERHTAGRDQFKLGWLSYWCQSMNIIQRVPRLVDKLQAQRSRSRSHDGQIQNWICANIPSFCSLSFSSKRLHTRDTSVGSRSIRRWAFKEKIC